MEDVHAHLRAAWERAAPTYERAGAAHHAPFSERLAQLVLLGPGGHVLDVGCGAGGALLPAARRVGKTGEAVGIDLAAEMVERTRAAAQEAGLEQVRAERMDGADAGFEDEYFDAVLAAFTLSAIPDAEHALAEWRRVLRPSGTLGVAVWKNLLDDAWRWEGELNNAFAHEVPQELLETVGRLSGRFAGRREAPRRARGRGLPRRHGRAQARRPDASRAPGSGGSGRGRAASARSSRRCPRARGSATARRRSSTSAPRRAR